MKKKKIEAPAEEVSTSEPVAPEAVSEAPVEPPVEAPNATVQALRATAEEVVRVMPQIGTNVTTRKQEHVYVGREVGDTVEVYQKNGKYIRTYTLREHGKDYAKLAEQFITKKNNQLV